MLLMLVVVLTNVLCQLILDCWQILAPTLLITLSAHTRVTNILDQASRALHTLLGRDKLFRHDSSFSLLTSVHGLTDGNTTLKWNTFQTETQAVRMICENQSFLTENFVDFRIEISWNRFCHNVDYITHFCVACICIVTDHII